MNILQPIIYIFNNFTADYSLIIRLKMIKFTTTKLFTTKVNDNYNHHTFNSIGCYANRVIYNVPEKCICRRP